MWRAITLIVLFGARLDIYAMNSALQINDTAGLLLPILKFPETQICYNLVYFDVNPDRFSEAVKNFQVVHLKSVQIFKFTSSRLIERADCNLFVIFTTHDDADYELIKRIPFRSFSRILIVFLRSPRTNRRDVQMFTNYWFRKSISVLFVDYSVSVYDLAEFLNDDIFIDRLLRNENGLITVRTSFFNCPPFVISYKQGGSIQYDGIEMRCLREITRNWVVTYRDNSKIRDTWCAVLTDLTKNVSDIAMCSVWESLEHSRLYDLSNYISQQCVTILVPKPSAITQASIIYMPFHWSVWLIFMASLIVTAIAIKYATDFELNLSSSNAIDRKYKEFVYVIFELVNISTSHGLAQFPYRSAIQLLFFGWILLMFLLDTGYSTVYTSIMTIPQYSKPTETIQDFLDSDLKWTEPVDLYAGMQYAFRNTGNANLMTFANRVIVDNNLNDRLNLLENRKLAKIVKVLSNKYVTDLDFVLDYAVTMTPMKECIFNYYSVFAFQQKSQFTKIFDRQINRMKAAGLFDTWFDLLISQHFNETLMHRVLEYHYGRNDGPKTLELKHLTGGFYLLFTGLAISCATLVLEVYWKRLTYRNSVNYF